MFPRSHWGLLLALAKSAPAQMAHDEMMAEPNQQANEFQRIEQPLWSKGAVTATGLSLVGIDVELPQGQTTVVEFTPTAPGEYEFMCGMKMNFGTIEVRPATPSLKGKSTGKATVYAAA